MSCLSIRGGIIVILTSIYLSSCCDGVHFTPAVFDCDASIILQITAPQDSIVDSIVNLENQETIDLYFPRFRCNPDSGYCHYRLPLDPTRLISSFVIYYQGFPSDTVAINHYYEEAYEKCRGDYFELESRSVRHATFTNSTLENSSGCMIFSVNL